VGANLRAIKKEIQKAREKTKGIIAMNFMAAMNNYELYVKKAVEEKIDLIVSGAGLPFALPKLVKGTNTKIAPIVSSVKAAKIIIRSYLKSFFCQLNKIHFYLLIFRFVTFYYNDEVLTFLQRISR
jgi:NAD(P)H-dependent flavin oxidoreductase YrpB (nitropropane dioxygenase family)